MKNKNRKIGIWKQYHFVIMKVKLRSDKNYQC